MSVGQSVRRVDAVAKVTGEAKYTSDLLPANTLYARQIHATVANGRVLKINGSAAEKVPGFVRLITCFDVPSFLYPTAGHPWSVEEKHQDIADRPLLTSRVRLWGDPVAVVIAETQLAADKAARLVTVEYESWDPVLDPREAMDHPEHPLHDAYPDNLIAHSGYALGEMSYEEAKNSEPDAIELIRRYDTQTVQHCHLELAQSLAYMEGDRITVVSSTQIPHIIRRIIGQALNIPLGRVRVIKPYIGGGFGNKQDALTEPLSAYLTTQVGGRPVLLELSREETFTTTRVRHAISFDVKALVRKDGTLIARKLNAYSAQGAYASHAHSICANSTTMFKQIYRDEKALEGDGYTVYTNMPTGGAMRGYGIPQIDFAVECMADDLALQLGMDPIEFRLKNCVLPGYQDPHTGIPILTYGLKDCIEKGRQAFDWDRKRAEYANQTGPVRRGIGMSIFLYKTGVWPISLETAAARATLNQDGSVMLQMSATEIGQGADTVFSQMLADAVGIRVENVHIVSTQDTDISPFDTGAYASRQTYISGTAAREVGLKLRERILEYAAEVLGRDAGSLTLEDDQIRDAETGNPLRSLASLAEEAQYSLTHSVHLTAEYSYHCEKNTISSGACFAEVEVDIPMCRVKILRIMNIHDSGKLINPRLAEAQVHGGMSMGIGYGLFEEMLFGRDGRPLNDNLLDYKLPTAMDTPELEAGFVELDDPSGPYGNKALGEPPAIPPAPAIRNAVLNATGVAIDRLPLSPQRLFEHFAQAGLIREEAQKNV